MALDIGEVLGYLNNYFVYTYAPNVYVDIASVEDASTITLADDDIDFDDIALDIKADQYIRIVGTRLNDGVYKVSGITDNVVTVEATLIDEESDEDLDHVTIYELAIPRKLVDIITEMIAWSGTSNIISEKLGPHSVTYDKPVTVFNSFESRLKRWKKIGWR